MGGNTLLCGAGAFYIGMDRTKWIINRYPYLAGDLTVTGKRQDN